ncbi:MAG: glycoside hydrolase family 43 protein [Bacteroidales bacterium]|nr:glycoside hydrolase family 43 protein [Bacteroidales bacterium]
MKRILFAAAAVLALASCSVKAPEGTAMFDYFRYEGCDDYYVQHPLPGDDYAYNPILAGWYSDPSICSNGQGDYFLVTSTFTYFPGVPIFHSRDLLNWEQIGNVLDRPEQLPHLDGQRISGGIYAPDIQYNPANKTYYMITTDVEGGNFYVKTQDPWGDWSDPIYVPVVKGIDPSFFFDDNGKAYIVSNDDAPDGKPEYNGHRTIRCVEFDVAGDCTVGERKIIVNKGSRPEKNPYWIEGPHIYKIDGTYYLMCAEGGTNFGEWHSEVVFKGASPFGPFVSFEGNPILTQVGLDPERPDPVSCAGHADLVKDGNGQWWAVFLADRPYRENFENLGRETFMLPVNWTSDGFPVILPAGESVPMIVRHEGVRRSENVTFGNFSFSDDFDAATLGDSWLTMRSPAADLYSLSDEPGFLKLNCSDQKATGVHTPAFVGHRLHHHKFSAQTRMYFTPSKYSDAAGLLLFKDERHQYFFKVSKEGIALHKTEFEVVVEQGKRPRFEEIPGDMASAEIGRYKFVDLKVTSDGETFSFWYAVNGKKWEALIEGVDASFLTSASAGGFTGTLIGAYAVK